MNSNQSSHRAGAFTLVELLCVIAIIAIIAALLLPALNQSQSRVKRIGCENNLHQVGIAFQVFTHDHNDKFPMAVPMAGGGSLEYVQNGYAMNGEFYFSFRQFQALSYELNTPAVLVCPTDTRLPATDFGALQNSNVSYFIGVKAEFSNPDSILAGDRNLTANSLPNPSILHLDADNRLWWTRELHQFKGNILFAGGRVEEWNDTTLAGAGSQQAGADLFMPSVLPIPNAPAPATAGYRNYSGANPGVESPPPPTTAIPPPPTATPAPPATSPTNNPPGSQGGFSRRTPGQPGTRSMPDTARTSPPGSLSTNVPAGGTVAPEVTDSETLTFDQRLVKMLRRIIIGFYLLVLLVLLLWLLFLRWRKSQRRKMQSEDGF